MRPSFRGTVWQRCLSGSTPTQCCAHNNYDSSITKSHEVYQKTGTSGKGALRVCIGGSRDRRRARYQPRNAVETVSFGDTIRNSGGTIGMC